MAVVLVTGCSSGFGLLTVCELARRGDTVFASMRDVGKRADLDEAVGALGPDAAGTVELVPLDVTDDGSVREAVRSVLDRAGRIDAVVNNAGIGTGGSIEELAIADFESLLATNVVGPLRVIQAVLPTMRAQGAGHIVNVTSVAAFVAPPFMGAYAATKHATDALGEALAVEVAPFGIHVTNVAPGAYETAMLGDVDAANAALDDASPYTPAARSVMTRHAGSMRDRSSPEEVAVAIADAIHAEPPPARVVVPPSESFIVGARGTMPPEQLRGLLASAYDLA